MVSLEEAKLQLRVDGSEFNSNITDLCDAISETLDGPDAMTGRALGDQTWEAVVCDLDGDIFIPVPGATAVDSISYFDTENAEQALTVATYFRQVVMDGGLLLEEIIPAPDTYDRIDAATITISAGGTVPKRIKQAALLILSRWFDNSDSDIPPGAKSLIDLERSGWVKA